MIATAMTQEPLSDWQRVEREFACAHRAYRLAFKTASNGAKYYRVQCQHCGETVRQLSKGDLSAGELASAVPFDEDRLRWHRERKQARVQELWEERQSQEEERREQEAREWRRRYESHVNPHNPKWRALRAKVLKRANGWCEGCGERGAVEVHHLTYAHLGAEFLWELQAVCRECHERVHQR